MSSGNTGNLASIRYHVVHETAYHYEAPVSLSQHLLHLTPRDYDLQRVLYHDIEMTPDVTEYERYEDWFGNRTVWLAVRQPHEELRLISVSTVEVCARPAAWRHEGGLAWEEVVARLDRFPGEGPLLAQECVMPSTLVPQVESVRQWVRQSFPPGCPVLEGARDLMHRIHAEFAFDPDSSDVGTSVAETFKNRRGVCQDFTHLMISALRSLGLAARYMSGYILTTPPPGKPRMVGADASHAWVSLWCPGIGWVDFDPTNNLQPNLEHVVIGWGRDFSDITPMRGVILGGAAHEVDVRVTVMPTELRSLASLLEEVRTAEPREKETANVVGQQ